MVPRRDWILLPLLSLLTVCSLATFTEFLARRIFVEAKTGSSNCMVLNDPSTGVRGIPNCVVTGKYPESKWVEYRFNRCGHRSGTGCGPKQPGTYKIVLIGSSAAMGDLVQQEESFAARLPGKLSLKTGRSVDVYDEGMGYGFSHSTTLRLNDVLSAQPDLILWVLFPMDIERAALVLPTPSEMNDGGSGSLATKAWRRMAAALAAESFTSAIADVFSRTRTALLLRHLLYQSQSQYVKSYLMGPDDETGFLKAELSPQWRDHLQQFDRDAEAIGARAKAAGVPFVATLAPNRAQAAMISAGAWPDSYDPYKLDQMLRSIVINRGGIYVDILPGFQKLPDPEQYYFPVDGHPDPEGHAELAALLTDALTSGPVPALSREQGASASENKR